MKKQLYPSKIDINKKLKESKMKIINYLKFLINKVNNSSIKLLGKKIKPIRNLKKIAILYKKTHSNNSFLWIK